MTVLKGGDSVLDILLLADEAGFGPLELVERKGLAEVGFGQAVDLSVDLCGFGPEVFDIGCDVRVGLLPLGFKFLDDPVGDLAWKSNGLDGFGNLAADFFLPDIRIRAVTLDPLGAAQVVVAFLRLGSDEAAAVAAAEDSTVGVGLEARRFGLCPAANDCLNLVEEFLGDDRLMPTLVGLSLVDDDAAVEGIGEHPVVLIAGQRLRLSRNRAVLPAASENAALEAKRIHRFFETVDRVLARRVEFKHRADKRSTLGVQSN